MEGRYEPKYKWKRTKLDANDEPSDFDWLAYDGDVTIGRIRFETHGPTKDLWQWSGQGPRVRQRILPHQGYMREPREAMRAVEDYYHRLMRHNGRRGTADLD